MSLKKVLGVLAVAVVSTFVIVGALYVFYFLTAPNAVLVSMRGF